MYVIFFQKSYTVQTVTKVSGILQFFISLFTDTVKKNLNYIFLYLSVVIWEHF